MKRLFSMFAAFYLTVTLFVCADLNPHPVFTDNMVLQRGVPVRIFGTGQPGTGVTVEACGQKKTALVAENNTWFVELDAMRANRKPSVVRITDSVSCITFTNILVGDVWLCSGQSNMDRPYEAYSLLRDDIERQANPEIRLLVSSHRPSRDPVNDPSIDPLFCGSWQECSPQYLRKFSATAYFFGAKLNREQGVPIGLIESAWGGTRAEAWTPSASLAELGIKREEELIESSNDKLSHHNHSVLYNGMIHPYRDFVFKGVIWYQGESNSKWPEEYGSLFSKMIESWRDVFNRGDIPFYFVQLAPFKTRPWNKSGAAWAWLRESQAKALGLRNTGMIVTTDLGEYEDIHPQAKQPVGERLALLALKDAGRDVVAQGPSFKKMEFNGNKVVIEFEGAENGLETRRVIMNKNRNLPVGDDENAFIVPETELRGFTICGLDRKFVEAKAEIKGNSVLVWSDSIERPVAVRYGWANFPLCNLYNSSGLPASPFRTDSFDAPDFFGGVKGKVFSGTPDGFGAEMIMRKDASETSLKPVRIHDRSGFYVVAKKGRKARFAYFKTMKKELKNGKSPEVLLRVLYYDRGKGGFELRYDSNDNTYRQRKLEPGVWKPGGRVTLGDTGQWRVAEFRLNDVRFSNRCNGYDLRLQSYECDFVLGGVFVSSLSSH